MLKGHPSSAWDYLPTWHLGSVLRVNYNRSIRESQRVKGLRSKLRPKEFKVAVYRVLGLGLRIRLYLQPLGVELLFRVQNLGLELLN